MARKARTCRTSLIFRRKIHGDEGVKTDAFGVRAAELFGQVGADNLLLEARRLLDAIFPSLWTATVLRAGEGYATGRDP